MQRLQKIKKAVPEMANHFNLGVDEDVTEELLGAVSEELTNAVIFNWYTTRIFKTCSAWLFSQRHWPLFP